ncbi:hypothetical protein LINGRAHAP2_LOCUS2482 [Linum grandiflorum]
MKESSFNSCVQKAGFGVLSVNPEGQVVDGVAGRFFCRTPIVAEAQAVLAGCVLASREEGRADVWSDCREVVVACNSAMEESPWECSAIIASIQGILRTAPLIQVRHCKRQFVAAADAVARKARDGSLRVDWLSFMFDSSESLFP